MIAAGNTPFVAAIQAISDHSPVRLKLSVLKGFRSSKMKSWIQRNLAEGSTVISDKMPTLKRLQNQVELTAR